MTRIDSRASPVDDPAQGQRLLGEAMDRAKRTIEESRAEIARSKALGESVAELSREIERTREAEKDVSHAQKNGT